MPIYPAKCLSDTCGHLFEDIRPMAQFDQQPNCPKCDGPTEKAYVPSGVSINSPAIVIYKASDGTYRFPGDPDPNSRASKRYDGLGYERMELRGWSEVRRAEAMVGRQQASEIRQRAERQCEAREQGLHERRSEIRRCLEQGFQIPDHDERGRPTGRMKTVRFSPHATDLMRHAIARNEAKPRPKANEPGCFFEVYSMTRSNRDEGRRSDGKKFHD